jgi:polysaccharide biosynthesis protein PslH
MMCLDWNVYRTAPPVLHWSARASTQSRKFACSWLSYTVGFAQLSVNAYDQDQDYGESRSSLGRARIDLRSGCGADATALPHSPTKEQKMTQPAGPQPMVAESLYHDQEREDGIRACGRKRKLRVLFITEFLPWPLDTGGRIRAYHILRQVAQRHEVTLVTQKPPGGSEGEEQIRALVSQLYSVPLKPRSFLRKILTAAAFLASSRPHIAVYSHYRKALARLISRLTSGESFDIAHLDHLDAAVYLQNCSPNAAVFLDEHNYETSLLQSTRDKTSKALLRWYLNSQLRKLACFERQTLRAVDAVSVVSARDAHMVVAAAPYTDQAVIPNGVDVAFFDIPRQPRPYRVVSVCSLDWLPNVEGLLWFLDEVWPSVVEARPDATFHMAGRNPQRALLRRVSRGVSVAGSVADIRKHVQDATAFVIPLLAGGGTRLRVLEAMAMRIPIVSTSVGVEGIECTHGRHVLIADTAEDFVHQLIALLDRGELGESLAMEGRQLVERHYSWQAIGDRLDAFYRRIVAEPSYTSRPVL